MTRQPTTVRRAVLTDVPFLTDLWSGLLRDAGTQDQAHDLELIIKSGEDSAEQRLLIAEYDGEPAGAVLLTLTTMSPLNLEPVVRAMAPHVAAPFRRRGVGHVLMDAAVTFAEEVGATFVMTAVLNESRPANRFMARLAFAPQAVLRVGATPTVRARLHAHLPSARPAGRPSSQVLAARRSLRRSRGEASN
jgi:GNAT superfamily N-acetyltransferase